jgi:hypothetical protein
MKLIHINTKPIIMKSILIVSILIISLTTFSQSTDCNKILEKEINIEKLEYDINEFKADLKTLVECEFEPIDYQILAGPTEMLPNIAIVVVMGAINDSKSEGKVFYRDFKENFIKIKNSDIYPEMKKSATEYNEFAKNIATTKNWNKTIKTLLKFEIPESDIDTIRQIIEYLEQKGELKPTFGQIISDIYAGKRNEIDKAHDMK